MAQVGRPTVFTPELGRDICRRLSEGESLRKILKDDGYPNISTVMRWLFEDTTIHTDFQEFQEQYARARQVQAELRAEEIIAIADDSEGDYIIRTNENGEEYEVPDHENIQRARLRVDARKWVASKLLPKVYGDKVSAELTGKNGGPIQTEDVSEKELARRIAFALAQGQEDLTCH